MGRALGILLVALVVGLVGLALLGKYLRTKD
jgi:hypothetical protein